MSAGNETLESELWMPGNDLCELAQSLLRDAACGLKWQRLGPETKLEHYFVAALFQGSQKGLANIGGINVAFGGAGMRPVFKRGRHFRVAREPVINVGRDPRGSGD